MAATTPNMPGLDLLPELASRYIDVDTLPWKPTPTPGVDMKILVQDQETGLLTALFRWAPGTVLPLHEHVEIEQTYVLEGSIVDDEGEVTAGNFVWRPREIGTWLILRMARWSFHFSCAPTNSLVANSLDRIWSNGDE